MKCIDCPHFRITAEPLKYVDFGHAVCGKYDLVADFLNRRKLKRLECVDGGANNDS